MGCNIVPSSGARNVSYSNNRLCLRRARVLATSFFHNAQSVGGSRPVACRADNLPRGLQPSRGFIVSVCPPGGCFVRGRDWTFRSKKQRPDVDYRYALVYADDLRLTKFSGGVFVRATTGIGGTAILPANR